MIDVKAYKAVRDRFGTLAMLHDAFVAAVNKVVFARLLIVYFVSESDPEIASSVRVDIHRMSDAELAEYTDREGLELPAFFVREAAANGDECFGAFVDGQLTGYAWYALSASTSSREVTTHFAPDTVYAYKNLTLPVHRGLRIQRLIKSHCLAHYKQRGKRGMIVAIESQNFASRRSTAGSGGKVIGYWLFAMGRGWYLGFGTPGCKSVGYRLTDARRR